MPDLVAVPGFVVVEDRRNDAWQIWYAADRTDPARHRELIAVADSERFAEWVAAALTFWTQPGAGQDAARAAVLHDG
jgi:hypothetical protein